MKEDIFQLGIKALVTDKEDRVLLLKVNVENLNNTKEAYWDIPGGRIHRGDSVENTLKREVEEETGITTITKITPFAMVLSNIRIPVGESDVGLILSVYECVVDEKSAVEISEEHTEYVWIERKEAAELLKVKYPKAFTDLLIGK